MILIKKKWTIFPPWNKTKELASQFESMEKVFNIKEKIISKSPQSEIFVQEIDDKQYFIKRYSV